MSNLLNLALLVTSITSANLTVYPEHNPTDDSDYLHIHFRIDDVKKNQLTLAQNSKIIYKLGTKLKHDETFIIKICPVGTIDKVSASVNNQSALKDCVSDKYGSLIGLNYYAEVPIYQFRIQTYYKTCFFGGATSEAERSLVTATAEDLKVGGDLNNKNLFYTKSDEIIKKYEDTKNFNYRHYNSVPANEDFRCTLQFNIEGPFDFAGFTDNIKFISNNNEASIFIIEYSGELTSELTPADIVPFPKNDSNVINDRRKAVVNNMKASTYFERSEFLRSDFNFELIKTKKTSKGIPLRIGLERVDEEQRIIDFPIELQNLEYVRFIPFVCKMTLSKVETSSYMFLNSKDCTMVGNTKVLIIADSGTLNFFSYIDKPKIENKISLPAVTMDFKFYSKNNVNTVYTIKGFEERTDAVYDSERRVVYHISYQKTTTTVDNKLIESDTDQTSRVVPIKLNGKDKVEKRLLEALNNWQNFGILLILVFSCVLMGAVYFWGSTILAMISFLIIIIAVFIIKTKTGNRLLNETVVEYKEPSFVDFMTVPGITNHQNRIKLLSGVTTACFKEEKPWITRKSNNKIWMNKIVAEINFYNQELIDADNKAKQLFTALGIDETGFSNNVVKEIKNIENTNETNDRSKI